MAKFFKPIRGTGITETVEQRERQAPRHGYGSLRQRQKQWSARQEDEIEILDY